MSDSTASATSLATNESANLISGPQSKNGDGKNSNDVPNDRDSDGKALRRLVQVGQARHASVHARDILLFLIAFRILNALSVRTFFQPDEYFQSLEPAWQIAFGEDSGAWITWVSPSIKKFSM